MYHITWCNSIPSHFPTVVLMVGFQGILKSRVESLSLTPNAASLDHLSSEALIFVLPCPLLLTRTLRFNK